MILTNSQLMLYRLQLEIQLKRRRETGEETLRSRIIIKAEELHYNNEVVYMQFRAENLEKKNWLGYADSHPFLEIQKSTESNNYIPVYRSEVLTNSIVIKILRRQIILE